MSLRRVTDRVRKSSARTESVAPTLPVADGSDVRRPQTALAQRRAGPHSLEEAEERYVAARDEWLLAMRAANSGRPADLAALALTQEAYEQAMAEVGRWRSGARVAIPIEPDPPQNLDVAVEQEIAWREVRGHQNGRGDSAGRFLRRLIGGSNEEPPDR